MLTKPVDDPDSMVALHDAYGRVAYVLAFEIAADAQAESDIVEGAFRSVWRATSAGPARRADQRTLLLRVVRGRPLAYARQLLQGSAGETCLEADPDRVGEALATLTPDHRAAIEFALRDHLTVLQIAEKLGLTPGAVRESQRSALLLMRVSLAPVEQPVLAQPL